MHKVAMGGVSTVYFIAVSQSDNLKQVQTKLARLIKESRLLDCVGKGTKVAIKLHFGEEKNLGFVRPEYVRLISEAIAQKGAAAFLADTNTLYRGRRTNSQEHLQIAYEHGFTPEIAGARVIIADDTKSENIARIPINQRLIKEAKIAKIFSEAPTIVVVSHFKGHLMTGFGGALKNLGMGCATREGKLEQHSDVSPVVTREKCVGCEACAKVCPVDAFTIKNKKADLDRSKCIGCASCLAACTYGAIDVDWDVGADTIQEKMVEYALALLKGKANRCVFFNFATKITKECDCLAKDDPRIAPDIGILAAADPVSVDKASLDLINKACGRDIFKDVHPNIDGNRQLEYAFALGLGNLDYRLETL